MLVESWMGRLGTGHAPATCALPEFAETVCGAYANTGDTDCRMKATIAMNASAEPSAGERRTQATRACVEQAFDALDHRVAGAERAGRREWGASARTAGERCQRTCEDLAAVGSRDDPVVARDFALDGKAADDEPRERVEDDEDFDDAGECVRPNVEAAQMCDFVGDDGVECRLRQVLRGGVPAESRRDGESPRRAARESRSRRRSDSRPRSTSAPRCGASAASSRRSCKSKSARMQAARIQMIAIAIARLCGRSMRAAGVGCDVVFAGVAASVAAVWSAVAMTTWYLFRCGAGSRRSRVRRVARFRRVSTLRRAARSPKR